MSTAAGSHAVRKSALGRTSLFLTEGGVTVRNVGASTMGSVRAAGTVYHNLSQTETRVDDICCWHCCEPLQQGRSYRVPKHHDLSEDLYYVFGHFCSLSCGKAYILESDRYDRGYALNVFHKMARAVYGVRGRIVETPPRIALRKFGGPFPVPRETDVCRPTAIVEPPFVSYCMLVEEREQSHMTAGERFGLGAASAADGASAALLPPCRFDPQSPTRVDDDFTEPPSNSMYDDFVQQQQQQRQRAQEGATAAAATTDVDAAAIAAAATETKSASAVARRPARKRAVAQTADASSDAGTLRRFRRQPEPPTAST